jgi:hypothetical protein
LGVPGSGFSFRHQFSSRPAAPPSAPSTRSGDVPPPFAPPPPPREPTATPIASAPAAEISSEGLAALRKLIVEVRRERAALGAAIPGAEHAKEKAEARLRRARSWFWGLFLKSKIPEREAALAARSAELVELQERLEGSFVDADTNADESTLASYERLVEAFQEAAQSQRIWDVTSSQAVDRVRERSRASVSIERRLVSFSLADQDPVLQTGARSLHLQNANGADLVVYSGFLLMETAAELALVDLRDIQVEFSMCSFTETEGVPSDSRVAGQTWAKVNKDGSPDRRFRDNYQIPIARYGELVLKSRTGLHEAYLFSNLEASRRFADRLREYQAALTKLGEREPSHEPPPVSAPPPAVALESRFQAVEFLRGRAASGVDDATQTMIGFAQLLQGDLESQNGKPADIAGWTRYLADVSAIPDYVREFFARSPSARSVENVAMREVNKLLRSVLEQLHSGLLQASADPEAAALADRVRAAAERLTIRGDLS